MDWWHVDRAFVTFDRQDSGCLSWGVEHKERRWFVKTAVEPAASAGLARVVDLHRAVTHDVLVAPLHVLERPEGVTLIFPWRRGRVLNRATVDGADRSELAAFRRLSSVVVEQAVDQILDAHVAVAAAGWVVGDLYDGCFLYDRPNGRMSVIDLDEYRPGPFTLDADRMPGSARYMAPRSSGGAPGSTIAPASSPWGGPSST